MVRSWKSRNFAVPFRYRAMTIINSKNKMVMKMQINAGGCKVAIERESNVWNVYEVRDYVVGRKLFEIPYDAKMKMSELADVIAERMGKN